MKKFFVFIILFYGQSLFAQSSLFDSRFVLANGSSQKLDLFHDWSFWTSFVEISPSGQYALLEFGPKLSVGPGAVKLRTGLNISASENGTKYLDQTALVVFVNWGTLSLLSVNEITNIGHNALFRWNAGQYYYEHDLKYKFISAHIEAVWLGNGFKPFVGPQISFPVGSGHLVIWPAIQWQNWGYKLIGIEYNFQF